MTGEAEPKRNPWDWAYQNGWAILTAVASLVGGAIIWVSWASFKIESISERIDKWEDRLWEGKMVGQQQQQAVTVGLPDEEKLRIDAQDKIIQEMARANVFRTVHAKVGKAGAEGHEARREDDSTGAGRVAPGSDQRAADGDDSGT